MPFFIAKRLSRFVNRLTCPRYIERWSPDIFHETYYDRTGVAPKTCPTVVTAYDMIHELFPDDFSRLDKTAVHKRIALSRADHIISISNSTRDDLIRILGIPEHKISVVHLGFERFVSALLPRNCEHIESHRPFLLYVGNRSGYKNFSGFMRGFSISRRLKSDFDVIAFGGGPLSSKENAFISKLGLPAGQVKQIGGDDSLLGELYKGAAALIYPSLYEGFGLPPLEAMAHGCPVISSNTSSMPEVIGDAGVFFDPRSIEQIASAIEDVVYSSEITSALKARGIARLEHFSWHQCAEQTLAVYRSLAE